MSTHKDFRDESRKSYGSAREQITIEEIKVGALLRLADSIERMEKPYVQLLNDVERFRKRLREEKAENVILTRRIAALQGVITKMKKKNHENRN